MDWTFPQAEPTEPEEPDLKMDLPSIVEAGEHPAGFRPQLKHTATVPLGQFQDFIHGTRPVHAMSGSPTRDSIASTIDLDLGMVDALELRRPSTASSTADSIMTDMTSGNPFDLEEDPEQRELDRNRYSSHKQYRSEGGFIKRSSGRHVPMHFRGNSLSSAESDLDRLPEEMPGFEYNFHTVDDPSLHLNGDMSFDSIDLSTIPTFDHSSGFDEIRNWTDGLDDMVRHSQFGGTNGQSYLRSRQPSTVSIIEPDELEFPQIIGAHASALMEDAEPQLVVAELNRLLEDLGESFKATSRAIQQRAEVYVDEGDEGGSEMGSGNDSSGGPTGDEEETL